MIDSDTTTHHTSESDLSSSNTLSVSAKVAAPANTSVLFARLPTNADRVIVPVNDTALSNDHALPSFYCVHSASGVAGTDFLDLGRQLDPSIRFYGIQAPSKRMLDAEFGSSVESLADHYATALVKFQPEGPIMLGGYCVGAIIALAMAKNLQARGRAVGPLLVIDGVPENTGVTHTRLRPRYWVELVKNIPRWLNHGDLMRSRTLRSLAWSLSNNAYAISKVALGLKRGQRLDGGYSIDGIMDLSRYDSAHRSFINRLFGAFFAYEPREYSGEVVIYEAKVTPLLYLPQIGRTWKRFARQSEVVSIVGTHISMLREPYVKILANDARDRIHAYFNNRSHS